MQRSFLTRILSRKFILAFAQVVGGILLMAGYGESEVTTITGAIISSFGVLVYILVEGRIDAIALGKTAEQVQNAVIEIKDGKNPE